MIGVGGIKDYSDLVEFLFAGASCVQIGTAIYYDGLKVFRDICTGLERFMIKKGYQSVKEMVGKTHKY